MTYLLNRFHANADYTLKPRVSSCGDANAVLLARCGHPTKCEKLNYITIASLMRLRMRAERLFPSRRASLLRCNIRALARKTADWELSEKENAMAKAHDIEVFDQDDPCWEDMPFLKDSGCGILAFRNALAALNGCRPDVCELADWAMAIGAYRPDEAGLYRKTFYDNVEQAYGEKLGFSLAGQYWGAITDEGLTEHLLSGGTAVVHVPNHFLALVDYDAQTGRYRVLESKCSLLRFLRKDGLVSADRLSRGNTQVDWYVLIESRKQE